MECFLAGVPGPVSCPELPNSILGTALQNTELRGVAKLPVMARTQREDRLVGK